MHSDITFRERKGCYHLSGFVLYDRNTTINAADPFHGIDQLQINHMIKT